MRPRSAIPHFLSQLMSGIIVKPRSRIFHGHEWVYAAEVQKTFGNPQPGDVITLRDFKDRAMGVAIYNPQSQIVARRISRRKEELNVDFFERRLRRAFAQREGLAGIDPRLCRLVWSESDGLPGVVVDRYGDHFVLQTLTLAMDLHKKELTEALVNVFLPLSVIERNDSTIRLAEGMEQVVGVLHGEDPEPFRVVSNGVSFSIDLSGGQKTGLYLDQLDSYPAVAALAKGKRVLDCFCNQGGFALACAAAGAASVTAVDSSEPAIATARDNAEVMGIADRIQWVEANVFDYLKAAEERKEQWDLIVLDPPSFARNKGALANALRGYKEIHLRAMGCLPNGGLLATFCCSHHVSTGEFRAVIVDAAVDAKKTLRQRAFHTQRPDHPIVPTIPETEYLRGYTYELMAGW